MASSLLNPRKPGPGPTATRLRCSHSGTLILIAGSILLSYAIIRHPLPLARPPHAPSRRPVAADFPRTVRPHPAQREIVASKDNRRERDAAASEHAARERVRKNSDVSRDALRELHRPDGEDAHDTLRDDGQGADTEAIARKGTVKKDVDAQKAHGEADSLNSAAEKSTRREGADTEGNADDEQPVIAKEDDPVTEFRRNELPNKTSPTGDLSCFLYDRPPRSGSTTMGRALKGCLLQRLRFSQPHGSDLADSNLLVTKMMTVLTEPQRVLVSKHLRFSREDVAVIRKRCRDLFYVTSCRPIRERIWSRMKYMFKPGNVNSTLTKENHELAIRKLVKNEREEPFLEGHPYLDRDENWIDIPEEEKLVPDYVVRNDPEGHYGEDLRTLLVALGCEGDFEATNIHVNEHESEDVFSQIKLNLGDTIYRKLKIHGDKVNQGGLRRAKAFVQAALAREE